MEVSLFLSPLFSFEDAADAEKGSERGMGDSLDEEERKGENYVRRRHGKWQQRN